MTSAAEGKICVCLRMRPITEADRSRGAFECASVVDQKRLLLVDPDKFSADPLRQNRAQEREFRFDAVFGPATSQSEVQEMLGAEGLVDSLVRLGRNGTVLAYGPTGTGKTHTMVGTRERPGLMTQMLRALYERLAETGDRETRVFISFMELYNELIRDLLNSETRAPLDLLEDERGNVQVPALSRVRAPNTNRILQLLQEGNARRTQEPTAANATSSRSHALLQISLWRGQQQRGKLFLIDLAGSERASHTQNQGQRLKEGAAINRSLLALGNVINALSAAGGRRTFVNFRDSKLTRLLKDSLAGSGEGARTVLIAHITPSSLHYDETFNTLTYASRARRIDMRLPQPQRRPASADRSYSNALTSLRREAQRAGLDLGHAASTGQLADDDSSGGKANSRRTSPPTIPSLALNSPNRARGPQQPTGGGSRANNNNAQNQQQPVKLPRIGTSLFDQLRDQHMASGERQQRLRERLLRANTEAFELEMSRQSRLAILAAYQQQSQPSPADVNGNSNEEEAEEVAGKYEKMAERMRRELAEQERRLNELAETRQKLEAALRRSDQNMRALETRMRGLARDAQQQQVVDLVRSLARQQAERAAIHSDFAVQSRHLRRQESQMKRLRRYDQVADKLITDRQELNDEEWSQLFREYRMLRGQISKMAMPMESGLPSWNAQVLARLDGGEGRRNSDTGGNDFGKTFTIGVGRPNKENHKLPELTSPQRIDLEWRST